jgi:hypothetical protein
MKAALPLLKAALPLLFVFALPAQAIEFANCAAAYRAGYWNMKRGEPGYSAKLDRDHDGVACETNNHWVHNKPETATALQAGGFYGGKVYSSSSKNGRRYVKTTTGGDF